VRPGIAGYGIKPAPHLCLPGEPGEMKQILSIHSRVSRVIPLAKGDSVSYGGTWTAEEETRAALIPIGYADGYLRSLSNRSWMSISGEHANVIGRVCMDQTMLHLPEGLPAETRQPVTVIGNGTVEMPNAPSLEEMASVAGSIPHEFITTMAPRLPKLYVRHGELVGVADLEGYRRL
jgi:alanine racemase